MLIEPAPMQLVCDMPVIHFRPVEYTRKRIRGKDNRVEIPKSLSEREVFTLINLCRERIAVPSGVSTLRGKQYGSLITISLNFSRYLRLSLLLLSSEMRLPNGICVRSRCRSESWTARLGFLDKTRHRAPAEPGGMKDSYVGCLIY